MESQDNHPPPFIHNPWDPPPPPIPPPNFQWGNPGFSNDVFPQFHPFHSPSHQSFTSPAGNFCPPKPHFPRKRKLDMIGDVIALCLIDGADDGNMIKLYVCGVPRTVTQEEDLDLGSLPSGCGRNCYTETTRKNSQTSLLVLTTVALIYRLFEDYGNVMEVIILPNKRTGQQQVLAVVVDEYCFVKFALIEEAERAIAALHNQFLFPEARVPIVVRYADAGRQRRGLERSVQHDSCLPRPGATQNDLTFSGPAIVGEALHKLYVNHLNREASIHEIEEIFSSYGGVADIYIMRDEWKQSRGCGFVGFTQKYMAVAAINGLNGSYVMKGCDKPLVVRFAEPKKPKNVDLSPLQFQGVGKGGVCFVVVEGRGQLAMEIGRLSRDLGGGSDGAVGCCQPARRRGGGGWGGWPAPNHGDMWGSNMPNAPHLDNSSTAMQVDSTSIQAGSFPTVANRLECHVSCEMQKPLQQPISPSTFSQMSLQPSESWQGSPQSFRQSDSQSQTPLHSNRTSVSSKELQNDHQSPNRCRDTGSNSVMLISAPASGALCRSAVSEDSIDCEWSEHICPDGCKYYYNCATCESRWEKPEEFALYEQQLQRQLLKHSCQESHPSALEASSVEEDCQVELTPNQSRTCDFVKPQLAMSCSVVSVRHVFLHF
ncbi:Flowering time control protein FCA [Bienertia sinuspersici]